jgi:hypothetical protein
MTISKSSSIYIKDGVERKEIVRVVKDKKSGDIRTWVNYENMGAERELEDFIRLICERYGNPFTTMTVKGLTEGMVNAAKAEIEEMKRATIAVASENLT